MVTLGALTVLPAVLLGVFLSSERIRWVIGSDQTSLLGRIMALDLAALAANMVLSAISLWLRLPAI